MNMKHCFNASLCILAFSIFGICQCPKNSDALYDRGQILKRLEDVLKVPPNAESIGDEFFIYDLTEPTNQHATRPSTEAGNCINFVDKHIYHFSLMDYEKSLSHIAILENGSLKIFKGLNCLNGENTLWEAVEYVEKNLKGNENNNEAITRLKNYRRYGIYNTIDGYRAFCNYDTPILGNSDKLYQRGEILGQLANVLRNSVSEKVKEQLSWRFLVEESRANGFFVYDLTEPTNKQTSLLERIEFKNNHIYHFSFIDLPFSFSNIVVLEDGKLKVFKTLNCNGKGDRLEDVISYLNKKLKNDKNKDEIIKRVKNYRSYGVYVPLNNLGTAQCEEAIKVEK